MRPRAAWAALAAGAAALAAGALAAAPAGACACGVAIEASVSSESALVIESPGREEIVLSLDLTSDPGGRAAVVLPVPAEPEVTAVERGDPLAYLEEATAPPPATGSGGDDAAAAPPVDVIGRETVGGYDVARLGAGDAAALDSWLAENGYALPAAAAPILAEYVEEDWRFVAIRLAPESDGRLKPLVVSFDTDEFVYPMRMAQAGTEPVNLTLFTLADGPRQVTGTEAVWQGDVAELSPPPPAALDGFFAGGGYVTRLEALGVDPDTFTADLAIEPAGEAPPTGATAVAAGSEDDGISTGALIAIVVAGLAFALGLALLTGSRRGPT